MSNLEALSKFFSEFSGHCFALWNKIFKKEYVDKFDESISYLEDGIFICRYLKKIKTICIINEPLYQYSLSEESLTRSLKPTPKRLSAFEGRKKMIDLVSQWKEIQNLAKAHYNETVRWILFSSYSSGFYEEIKPYIPEISRYSKEFFSIKTLSFKLKIRYWGYGFIVKHNIGVGIAKIWESLRKGS